MTSHDEEVVSAVLSALASFSKRLADAEKEFGAGSADAKRAAAANSVAATLQFLKDVDAPAECRVVLGYLGSALEDLKLGTVDPILRPLLFNSRHPGGIVRSRIKGFAAASLSAAMDTGMGQKEAAELIAQALNRAGFRSGFQDGRVARATVIDWRKDCNNANATAETLEAYESATKFLLAEKRSFAMSGGDDIEKKFIARLFKTLEGFVQDLMPIIS